MRTLKNLMLIILILGIFSCSGEDSIDTGDNGPEPGPEPLTETQTGVFRDSEVAGLNYETETKSGVTDADGKFEYLEGETVTFSVGDIVIGSGPASDDMTPISIASTENASLNSPEVKNIAAFLQTLDSDSDPSNGISISEETTTAISENAIDFTQPIESVLGEIVAEVNLATGSQLEVVFPEEATVHLAETTGDTYEPGVDVFKTFIPTLESWKTYPATSVYWIHETNSDRKLVRSKMYEKYPERILYEINYIDLMENGLPSKYSQTYYDYGEQGLKVDVEVNYDENKNVARFYRTNSDGSFNQNIVFTQLDEKNRVTEAAFYSANNDFYYREIYELLENGNNREKTRYASESGDDPSTIQYTEAYTYTNFGDIASQTIDSRTDNFDAFTWNYSYTEAEILESKKKDFIDLLDRPRTDTYFYDEEERVERLLIEAGDFVSDYVDFYPNGDPKRAETYYQGFLYEIIDWNEDGTSIWKTIEEEGSYKIEYKDVDENVLKTEYYDANGNFISTNP